MKKILIWDFYISNKNVGGPAGYLYNIRTYIKQNNISNIIFLNDILKRNLPENSPKGKIRKFIKHIDIFRFSDLRTAFHLAKQWKRQIDKNILNKIDLNEFDIIHFHESTHVLSALNILKGYRGKIVLTTHSPQPLSYEIADVIPPFYKITSLILKKWMLKQELLAWNKVDYLMFPVPTAIEPYLVEPKMEAYIKCHPQKLIYCPSSILSQDIKPLDEKQKKEINFDENKFNIVYIGRHNEVKGYAFLKEVGSQILEKYDDVVFYIAGREYPLKGIRHPSWKELGWVKNGSQIMATSDLFILPNRETYFDLVALEVLRAGTPLALSKTGGNKYFQSLSSTDIEGLFFFEYGSDDELINIVEKLRIEKEQKKTKKYHDKNKALFNKYFTSKSFIERYINLIYNL